MSLAGDERYLATKDSGQLVPNSASRIQSSVLPVIDLL
jgi:hypothetical protein